MSETDLVNAVTQALCPLQVGDWVELLDGSKAKTFKGGWNDAMLQYVGQICQMTGVDRRGYAQLAGADGYVWDLKYLRLAEPRS
jgi:hypothetical protein